MAIATRVGRGRGCAAAALGVALLDDFLLADAAVVGAFFAENGSPEAARDAAEAEKQQQGHADQSSNHDTGNGTRAEAAAVGRLAAGANGLSIAGGSCRGARVSARLNTSNGRGAGDSIRSRELRRGMAIRDDDDRRGLGVARLGRALALEGARLPSGAANGTAGRLLRILRHAIDAGGGSRHGRPVGVVGGGESPRLGPGARVCAVASKTGGDVSAQRGAQLGAVAAVLAVGAAGRAVAAIALEEKGVAQVALVVSGEWAGRHEGRRGQQRNEGAHGEARSRSPEAGWSWRGSDSSVSEQEKRSSWNVKRVGTLKKQ